MVMLISGNYCGIIQAEMSDDELQARIRELATKLQGCRPEEVDLSPEGKKAMLAELKTLLKSSQE